MFFILNSVGNAECHTQVLYTENGPMVLSMCPILTNTLAYPLKFENTQSKVLITSTPGLNTSVVSIFFTIAYLHIIIIYINGQEPTLILEPLG